MWCVGIAEHAQHLWHVCLALEQRCPDKVGNHGPPDPANEDGDEPCDDKADKALLGETAAQRRQERDHGDNDGRLFRGILVFGDFAENCPVQPDGAYDTI